MDFSTLEQAVEYYKGKYATRQNLSPKSCKSRRLFCIAILQFFRSKHFDFLSCEAFLDHLQKKNQPSSMQTKVKDLRAFVRFCNVYEYLEKDFSRKLIMPTVPKKIHKFVTEAEAIRAIYKGTEPSKFDNKLAQKSKIHVRQALLFASFTILRHSEVRRLTIGDIDTSNRRFVVNSKGGDVELAVLPNNLVAPMQEWIQGKDPEDRLFEVTEDAMRRSYHRGLQDLSLVDQRVHDLRHLGALTRLNRDSKLQKVSRVLRHKKLATTDEYYSHYNLQDLEETANNTPEIQKSTDPNTRLDGWEQRLKRDGLLEDSRFKYTRENDKLTVEIRKGELRGGGGT